MLFTLIASTNVTSDRATAAHARNAIGLLVTETFC